MNLDIVNKSTNPNPTYISIGDAGMDLRAFLSYEVVIPPNDRVIVPTGIYIQLEFNYEAQIRPRSGLAAKYGVTVLNSPGTIDSNYRGEIKIILINLGDSDFHISNGDRIAQMVINRIIPPHIINMNTVDKLDDDTARGENGFGHTGVK